MYLVLLITGSCCLAAWIYLLTMHGGFWRVGHLGPRVQPSPSVKGIIAVVIPARDEAEVIGSTIVSLLHQSCSSAIRIFLVDDYSSDGTAEVARRAANDCGHSEKLTIISGTALPREWTGKLWAVQQGLDRALRLNPSFLLLTDADIHHAPNNVATLIATAEFGNYDLTSFMVRLHCSSFPEKLLIPAFVFYFFMLYPPQWIRENRRSVAGAAGGCMLIRPGALQKAGGMEAIRDQIIDDCALANAVKRSGGRVWLGVTPETMSTREYGSFSEVERMISRTAFNQLRHSALLLLGSFLGLAITYLAPIGLLLSGNAILATLGATGWVLMTIAYAPIVRFYGLSVIWSLTLPAAAVFYMAATVHSALKYWSGRGGEWKGRTQDAATN